MLCILRGLVAGERFRVKSSGGGGVQTVEVDAYGTHGSPARFESDRRRDARLLTEHGIVVLRLTKAAIEQRPFEAGPDADDGEFVERQGDVGGDALTVVEFRQQYALDSAIA